MPKYYCHDCMKTLGLITPMSPTNPTATQYQLDKFLKHTTPTGNYALNSVFSDPSISAYSGYLVNAGASGCLEVDDYGRKNIVWIAGSPIGITIQGGSAI